MTVYAFSFFVMLAGGIWTPREEMWFPTLEVCEAARQGAEDLGAHTTDCERKARP